MSKLVIVLDFYSVQGRFPNSTEYNKELGCKTHDLRSLLEEVVGIAEKQNADEEASQDIQFLSSPPEMLANLSNIFSEYGEQGRYHDLNVLIGADPTGANPTRAFEDLLGSMSAERIIEVIPRLARALCRITQRTMPHELVRSLDLILGDFLYIEDARLSRLTFDWLPERKEGKPS